MPEIAATGDVYLVRTVGRQDGQATNNVMYFQAATPIDDVNLRLILALAECFVTHFVPVASSSWQLEKMQWQRVAPTLGPLFETVPPGTLVGGGNANALPSYASSVVGVKTAQGGRSHQGRFALPGIPEAATTNSVFDTGGAFWAGVLAFIACVASKFIIGDPPGANSFQMMVFSRKLGGTTLPINTAGLTAVRSFAPKQIIGTIRSRKVRALS